MPNPKWRHSKQRKRRRTHYKIDAPTLATCSSTGEKHLLHRAYSVDGALYYRGQIIVPSRDQVADDEPSQQG